MIIISFVQGKGGAGKTSLSTQLALGLAYRGKRVCLLDADEQENAVDFIDERKKYVQHLKKNPNIQRKFADIVFDTTLSENLHLELKDYKDDFDFIVIDTKGEHGNESAINKSIIKASDIIIVPIVPSPPDLKATVHTLELIKDALDKNKGKKAFMLINKYKANTLTRKSVGIINGYRKKYDIGLFQSVISDTIAFERAYEYGLSVYEIRSSEKKEDEERSNISGLSTAKIAMQKLCNEILNIVI